MILVFPPRASKTTNRSLIRFRRFFENKGAVGATFAIVGVVAVGIIFAIVTATLRRRRARRFDREIAEEAKRAPAPVFMDDDDDYNPGGYSAYGAHPGPHSQQHDAMSGGYPASGEGTPSNYMYPSGYSDLGFSDVSSHGTYSQQPMDGQYAGHAGYGAAAAAAAAGGYGAYEMTGYATGHGGQMPGYGAPQQQQDWAGHAQQAYVYPGEEQGQGYPPAPSATPPAELNRSKSGGGGRSLMDSYNSPPPAEQPRTNAMPQYADGYVAQYQQSPHVVEEDDAAYGGVESHHGHVGYDYEEDDGAPRVLKVANE
ncbi:hypothetical protein HMN09_01068700 [Mycena chlorophos]|uniref:Uncharacterized protein n=1 Tax=Mycena chlorophos TaxID=658473 RepID=A0A8H6SD96_MYCCL|nr:hypothetical protein HMN09_01068700 [Mycena chlorophos]